MLVLTDTLRLKNGDQESQHFIIKALLKENYLAQLKSVLEIRIKVAITILLKMKNLQNNRANTPNFHRWNALKTKKVTVIGL